MVLNPALYKVLIKHFGDVKIYNEGVARIEERRPGQRPHVVEAGESYNVDCPLCDDEKQRLSISYMWLMKPPMRSQRITHLAHCYNEDCEVHKPEFYEQFLEDLHAAELGGLDDVEIVERTVTARSQRGCIPMPDGCVPLDQLPDDHKAIKFILRNYPGLRTIKMVHYLAQSYGACFTDTWDKLFPSAMNRIIFPIWSKGQCVAWQGRTIEPDVKPRWYLPPGFVKCFYNMDRVGPYEIPILNEGVLNAIMCGPSGIAMFGKQLNTLRAEELKEKFSTVLIATDADTYVPDNRKGGNGRIYVQELEEVLQRVGLTTIRLPWPDDVIELAARHNNNEDVGVPDAAELGFKRMRELIESVI